MNENIVLVNTETITGQKITESLGVVRGSAIRARHVGKDLMAFAKNIAGGEIKEYTKLMAEAREQAIDRMVEEADKLGADGVVNIRFVTANVAQGAAELLVYGTAVKLAI